LDKLRNPARNSGLPDRQYLGNTVLWPPLLSQRASDLTLLFWSQMPSRQVHPPGVLAFLGLSQPWNDHFRTFDLQFLTDPPSLMAIEGVVVLINMYWILDPMGGDIRFEGVIFLGR
jgi:hypothetical protein